MIQCTNCGAGFTREEMNNIFMGSECLACGSGKYEEVNDTDSIRGKLDECEFSAQTAKEIYDNRHKLNAESWYVKTKDEIFEMIKLASLNGQDFLQINPRVWHHKEQYRIHLEVNLTRLGYGFFYNGNWVKINW